MIVQRGLGPVSRSALCVIAIGVAAFPATGALAQASVRDSIADLLRRTPQA